MSLYDFAYLLLPLYTPAWGLYNAAEWLKSQLMVLNPGNKIISTIRLLEKLYAFEYIELKVIRISCQLARSCHGCKSYIRSYAGSSTHPSSCHGCRSYSHSFSGSWYYPVFAKDDALMPFLSMNEDLIPDLARNADLIPTLAVEELLSTHLPWMLLSCTLLSSI